MNGQTDDFSSIPHSIAKFLKLAGKVAAFFVGAVTIFMAFFTIYGPENMRNILKAILDDYLTLKTVFQIAFSVALVFVTIAAILCVWYTTKTYHSLTREYRNNNDHLKQIKDLLEREKNLGILAINPRYTTQYSNAAYKRIFGNTNEELIISGHSLNKTINKRNNPDLRDEFMTTIIRLIENKRDIKILLLNPSNSQELIEKRKEFDDFVDELYGKLKIKGIQNETIRKYLHIKETDVLPYYIVKTEHLLYIAHYTFGDYMNNADDRMYIFEATDNFGYGKYCYDDFISCFDRKAVSIEQYQKMLEGDKNA